MLITWKPYELHPKGLDFDLTFMPVSADDCIREIWKRIEKIANENKIPIEFPSALSKSRLALESSEYARIDLQKYKTFLDLMYKAYFLQKQDIEKMDIILKVAKNSELNVEELEQELKSGLYTQIIQESKREAMAYGINGVPAFIVGTKKKMYIPGCQPIPTFKELFEKVDKENSS